jgi:hypothetical protein
MLNSKINEFLIDDKKEATKKQFPGLDDVDINTLTEIRQNMNDNRASPLTEQYGTEAAKRQATEANNDKILIRLSDKMSMHNQRA